MRRWTKVGAAVAATGGVAAMSAAAAGARLWGRGTARAVARLAPDEAIPPRHHHAIGSDDEEDSVAALEHFFSTARLAGLPAPVARYFTFALTPGRPLAHGARVEHAGEFAARPGKWRPFTSVEHFAVDPPGFVWDARIRMAPLVTVNVRDSYVRGDGAMLARVAGLVSVADQHGTLEMAEASLQRYVAESAWVPTALLPGAGCVEWSPIDDTTARATLVDRGVTAVVDFHFDERGAIVGTTASRYRDVNGTPVRTPWVGRFGDYMRVDGTMVPTTGSVEWVLADGERLPYWRGRLTAIAFDRAQ
ncbi:MAG TPA: DUF6544 family protein [Gemmatimonadaceae bacterium]|nr:DUF6544 family protein [Gemmatimonadaceae bacterium]